LLDLLLLVELLLVLRLLRSGLQLLPFWLLLLLAVQLFLKLEAARCLLM
jgi:hypothetical protein